jgi:hypothetical protein
LDQIGFLKSSLQGIDAGRLEEAKRVAVVIRVLCHQTNKSDALLNQLGLLGGRWLSSAGRVSPLNLMDQCSLIEIAVHGSADFRAPLDEAVHQFVPFDQWWTDPVILIHEYATIREYSRRDLVLHLANKDGGAHVDPKLNDALETLKSSGLGWTNLAGVALTHPERHIMRQIGHEVLKTLVPEFKEVPASAPGIGGIIAFKKSGQAKWMLELPSTMVRAPLKNLASTGVASCSMLATCRAIHPLNQRSLPNIN